MKKNKFKLDDISFLKSNEVFRKKDFSKSYFLDVDYKYFVIDKEVYYIYIKYKPCYKVIPKKIPITLLKNFEIINELFSKDEKNVFCQNNKLIGADPNTFEIMKLQFSKDKNHVYYLNRKLNKFDANSFEVLNAKYTKDKNHVYYSNELLSRDKVVKLIKIEDMKILEFADSETFKVVDCFYTKDKNYVYYNNQIVYGVDPNTFRLFEGNFMDDKGLVYMGRRSSRFRSFLRKMKWYYRIYFYCFFKDKKN